MHGPHQLAQKLSTTGFPRKSERLTSLPWESYTVKSGAGVSSSSEAEGSAASLEITSMEKPELRRE